MLPYPYQRTSNKEVKYLPPHQPHFQNAYQNRGFVSNQSLQKKPFENNQISSENICLHYIEDFLSPDKRSLALQRLFEARDSYANLPLFLWNSFGVTACMIQEIVSLYTKLDPPNLDHNHARHLAYLFGLIQLIAEHPQTREALCCSQLPALLFPYISVKFDTKPYEQVRLCALNVLSVLSKNISPRMLELFLSSELLPLCFKVATTFTESQRSVALVIVLRVMCIQEGLEFFCSPLVKLHALLKVLEDLTLATIHRKSRIQKTIVYIYSRLADHSSGLHFLKLKLPMPIRDGTFGHILSEDPNAKRTLETLLFRVFPDAFTRH
ncbi:RNA-binding protein, CCR4-NOT complex subunit Rcd1 [Entomophthora muscae]|uniref:RNA-binding protein, CCR4-NOT complex subunit Rcd1 n=1 Tax=Entomophthora muscae TaxID=34485 RepID=A0ACC2TMH2_9FUNG|nr:RNA-binding protein, CCR4-NOT complex subunit Rcd1 [Entomophthora muscae]